MRFGDTAGHAGLVANNTYFGLRDKANNDRLTILQSNGNVGIGNTSPSYAFHMGYGKGLRVEGGTTTADTANYFSFGGNGTFGIDAYGVPNGRFVVRNSGNVGIGTDDPKRKLDVRGDVNIIGDIDVNNKRLSNYKGFPTADFTGLEPVIFLKMEVSMLWRGGN